MAAELFAAGLPKAAGSFARLDDVKDTPHYTQTRNREIMILGMAATFAFALQRGYPLIEKTLKTAMPQIKNDAVNFLGKSVLGFMGFMGAEKAARVFFPANQVFSGMKLLSNTPGATDATTTATATAAPISTNSPLRRFDRMA
jgi:hypothetical protein